MMHCLILNWQVLITDGIAKLTLKQPVNISVHEDELPGLRKKLGTSKFNKLFKKKHSLIAAGLTKLMEEDKELWLAVKSVFTSKPGKVSVDLKNLEVRREDNSE